MGLLSFVQDLYENLRPTKSKVKSEKSNKRNYDFNDGTGFTGDRKKDMEFVKKVNVKSSKVISKEKKKEEENEK